MAGSESAGTAFGANSWLVEEMYEQYRADPESVGESWREFFEDYRSMTAAAHPELAQPAAQPAPPESAPAEPASLPAPDAAAPAPAPAPAPTPAAGQAGETGELIKGVGAVIVKNMEASLDVPTATSFRNVPAKLLEVNRKVINGYLGRTRGGKISFTHLIGYAVVQAVAETMPVMNNSYVEGPDGKPRVLRNEHVNLGLAVDLEKSDGSRTLLVPVIKNAEALDFRAFWGAYEDLIRKVRSNKLSPDD